MRAIPVRYPRRAGGKEIVADSLTDVTALARVLAGPRPPVLFDVRWRLTGPPGIDSYRAGHLPGARFVDLDRELAGPPGAGGRHPLPGAGPFQAGDAPGRGAGRLAGRGLRRGRLDRRGPGLVAAPLLRP